MTFWSISKPISQGRISRQLWKQPIAGSLRTRLSSLEAKETMSKVLSMSTIIKILSTRLLIDYGSLWGISLQSLVEPFFELYESLVLSKDHPE